LASDICINMGLEHFNYTVLASRIAIDNHQKNTSPYFSDVMKRLYERVDVHKSQSPLISDNMYQIIQQHKNVIDDMIDYTRDFLINYFGFKTLQKAYLKKIDNVIVERPQHMWMRVSIGIHGDDLKSVKETYDYLSRLYFTHATPTLFHAGAPYPQLSSCFLLGTSDSVTGIYKTITDVAQISKWAGGIGCHISNIRGKGSYIRRTGGYSDGILPMLKVYNHTARYINQSGKRNGSFAMYLEPWHADIFEFLNAKKNHGSEEERARDLFYGLWIPDRFMRAVERDESWYLMCPDECPGLCDMVGSDFDILYDDYVAKQKYKKRINARDVWKAVIDSQIETGTPYMLYKDACNLKSNQQNLGVIKSSNLCCEIIEYSDDKEYAVCNLASISLPKFIKRFEKDEWWDGLVVYTMKDCEWCDMLKFVLKRKHIHYIEKRVSDFDTFKREKGVKTVPQVYTSEEKHLGGFTDVFHLLRDEIDHQQLYHVTKMITKNLNKVIDANFYPTDETKRSNMRHRPIGLGVQGLADLFMEMMIPFDSDHAKQINKDIFETIYFASLTASLELARETGPYETFFGSPLSKGKFQFDLWGQGGVIAESRWDWETLRADIMKHGVKNSLLLAPMPTASTSQILGNNECFEPYTSNMYTRRTLAGEFTIMNKHLFRDLEDMGLWSEEMSEKLLHFRGSVQSIREIPKYLKQVYKTVWEIKQKDLIDMSADRGVFVDQSQSLNIFMEEPNYKKLTSCHFYGWKKGLKTGSYYIRSKPAMNSQSFTVDPEKAKQYDRECLMCGS
jgi:ribonucleoside-diphosphate reductase subunit M1